MIYKSKEEGALDAIALGSVENADERYTRLLYHCDEDATKSKHGGKV